MTAIKLLTVSEAADILAVSKPTVYRLVYTCELPGLKISGTLRIKEAALVGYIQKQEMEFEKDYGYNEVPEKK